MASNVQSETQGDAPPDVQVRALCKRFSQGPDSTLEVIDQLSFVVRRGALFVIVGPSGCGKTTLLRIISGSEKATSGSVLIDPANASRTAVIEQTPALLPWRTAFQNACIGAELRPRFNSVIASRVLDSFDTFGLKGSEYQFPETLSGGMQQRVAIIRALESRPRILFCDEPFSAIDFVTRLRLRNRVQKNVSRARIYHFVRHSQCRRSDFFGRYSSCFDKTACANRPNHSSAADTFFR